MNYHNIFYDGNEVIVFGYNRYGQLGWGDYVNRDKPTLLMKESEIKEIEICWKII